MTSRERMYAMLRGQPTDRAPRYIWVGAYAAPKLCAHYGVAPEALDERIGNDVRQTWLSINREMERHCAQGERFTDEWGNLWERQGYYNAVVRHALAGLDADEIRAYPAPGLFDGGRFDGLDRLLADYGDTHFIGADVSGTIFEPAYHLRGMEDFLMDLMEENDEAEAILDLVAAHSQRIALEAVRRGVDWIWLGDDLGTQNDMVMSPELWRRHIRPRMAAIIAAIRAEKPGMYIAYHSCGSIWRILPDLIGLGLDVINPLQESAAGMDHDVIRAQFGEKTTMFCGLDTQTFLLRATPEEVREATKSLVSRLGKNGHFLVGVSHTLQADIPTENIAAMIDTLDEIAEETKKA